MPCAVTDAPCRAVAQVMGKSKMPTKVLAVVSKTNAKIKPGAVAAKKRATARVAAARVAGPKAPPAPLPPPPPPPCTCCDRSPEECLKWQAIGYCERNAQFMVRRPVSPSPSTLRAR